MFWLNFFVITFKCCSFLGGFSAAVTTPLDVVKTRIMLANKKQVKSGEMTILNTFKTIYRTQGINGYSP